MSCSPSRSTARGLPMRAGDMKALFAKGDGKGFIGRVSSLRRGDRDGEVETVRMLAPPAVSACGPEIVRASKSSLAGGGGGAAVVRHVSSIVPRSELLRSPSLAEARGGG